MEHRACGAEATLKLRKTFRLLEGFKNRMSKTPSEMSKEELIALFESLTIKKASLEARRAELEHQLKLKDSNTGAADFRVVLGVEHVAADVNVLRQFLALRQQSQGRQPPRGLDTCHPGPV
jgi:hypothetical protein